VNYAAFTHGLLVKVHEYFPQLSMAAIQLDLGLD